MSRPRAGLLAAAVFSLAATRAQAADCEKLALSGAMPGQIQLRERVDAGRFEPQGGPRLEALPAFCRVVAVLKPVPQSEIRIEVWLPEQGWNGKLMGVGNGGWSGAIAYADLGAALRRGYAAVSTNTGHDGASGSFALGQPQKLIDFGYRAVHEMTLAAKELVRGYYGKRAAHSYWDGCSAGGRQGMQSAQRYPQDYDGIIAGAPAMDWTGRASSALRVAQAVRAEPGGFIDAAAMAVLERGALAACDANDGLADGVIEAPQRCDFDPGVLACGAGQSASCLTPTQITAARAIYSSPPNLQTGRAITGLYPGSEAGWATWGGAAPFRTALDHYRFVVTADAQWSIDSFRFDRDAPLAERMDGNTVNALNADLRPFFRSGGKLLHYHGWSDPQISPGVSPQYYEAVARQLGGAKQLASNYRLFMVPGMAHCTGGAGASSFDMLSVLEQWVEKGKAPESVAAQRLRNGVVDRSRLLCPYPVVAQYDGSGDPDAARSFRCVAP